MSYACNAVTTVIILLSAPITVALHFFAFARGELIGICTLIYDVWSE